MGVRAFIAIPTSTELKQEAASIQGQLREEGAHVRWEPPEKLHMTLKFLGSVEESLLDVITTRLTEITRNMPTFDVCYEEIGGFPSLNSPRILWIGSETNEPLSDLVRRIEDACASLGFAREDRPFHPHVTIGRVKDRTRLARLTAKAKSINFKTISERCSVVLLVRSELLSAGSRYSVLKSFPFPP